MASWVPTILLYFRDLINAFFFHIAYFVAKEFSGSCSRHNPFLEHSSCIRTLSGHERYSYDKSETARNVNKMNTWRVTRNRVHLWAHARACHDGRTTAFTYQVEQPLITSRSLPGHRYRTVDFFADGNSTCRTGGAIEYKRGQTFLAIA